MVSKRSRARGFRGLMNQLATLADSEDAHARVPRRRRELQTASRSSARADTSAGPASS
jgi:hypothetical protein